MVRLPTLLVAALAVLKARNEAAVTRATLSLTAFSRTLPGGLAARMASLGLPLTIIAEGLLEKAHAIAAGYQTRAIVPNALSSGRNTPSEAPRHTSGTCAPRNR